MTPGELFAKLWIQVSPHAGSVRAAPWPNKGARECTPLAALLTGGSGPGVAKEIIAYLAGEDPGFACTVAATELDRRAFVVMCALDVAAMEIHPSMLTRVGGSAIAVSPTLALMKQERAKTGFYGGHRKHRTLPKGRLTYRAADPEIDDASGANLETHFEYLTVLEPLNKGFTVNVSVVSPRKSPLSAPPTQIGFAPVAEDADDLVFKATVRGKRPYLDAQPAEPDKLQARTSAAVGDLLDRGAKLVVLPELVVPAAAVAALKSALNGRPSREAIVVSGSGLSTEVGADKLHFNEAVVMDGKGRELFRQRKVHPFNMAADRMEKCRVPFAKGHDKKAHLEDIQPDTCIEVCDLHGSGRLMVSICEDLEQDVPGGSVARALRPDWLITPVLDVSQSLGRWTHQRAIEVARKTGSHVVVSCSATLSVRYHSKASLDEVAPDALGVGLLYEGANRKVRVIDAAEDTSQPRAIIAQWDPDNWEQDRVGSAAAS